MFRKALISSIIILSNSQTLTTLTAAAPFFIGNQPKTIEVNNRILANVNGNPITVYDVMKKLDVIFYKQFPQYADSIEAKHQFYTINWKYTLKDLIDKELILADAKELNIPISNGDVRQEMEQTFGPNILANLDKIGLTYEEAQDIVQSDIMIRRMMGIRVNVKTTRKITPQAVREEYEKFSKENIRPAEWTYHIVSIRSQNENKGAEVAKKVHQLLAVDHVPSDEIKGRLAGMGFLDETTVISISAPFQHKDNEVSESFKTVLSSMEPNSYSEPQIHKSRRGGANIYRIFYMESLNPGGAIPLYEVESKIVDKIRGKAIDDEANAYLSHLREHFRVSEDDAIAQLPPDFQPFILL